MQTPRKEATKQLAMLAYYFFIVYEDEEGKINVSKMCYAKQ